MEQRRPTWHRSGRNSAEVDLRSATDALQRATESMVALTESVNRQLQQRESGPPRPVSYHAYRPTDKAMQSWPSAAPTNDQGSRAFSLAPSNPPRSGPSVEGSSANQVRIVSISAPGSQTPGPLSSNPPFSPDYRGRPHGPDISPRPRSHPLRHYDLPPVNTSGGVPFGAQVPHNHASNPSTPWTAALTPTADNWPMTGHSTPTLIAPVAAPAPIFRPTPPGSSRSAAASHVDLLEAAERFKTYMPEPWSPERRSGRYHDMPTRRRDPSPAMQMGGQAFYTQSTDDFGTSLLQHDTNKRLEAPLPKLPPSAPPHGFSLTHEILFVLVICLAQVLMLAGIGQALAPASLIGQSLGDTSPGALAWYSAAYGLTAGTFVLPAGRFGDLFGHKNIFIIGFFWFGLWSLITGFADMVQASGGSGTIFFCFCRAMQGTGPALLVPNGQAMLGRAYSPGPRKNLVMCLFGAAAPLGFVLGAVMSSLFAIKCSWPWAFWVLAAACVALGATSVPVLPPTLSTKRNPMESLWDQLDATGMFLGVAGLILVNVAFNQAPIVTWSTPYTYFVLVIGIMLIAAFIYVERIAAHPLVPVTAMTAQTNFVLGCTGTGWACFSVWVFYSFAFLENLRGWSPLLASAAYAHAPLSGLAASLLTGFLMPRIKPHWIMLISMCAFFVGTLLFATAPVDQSYWFNAFFSILIMPFGMDMSNPAATILLSNSVGKEHQGIAASLVVTVVNYSISIALGIAGTVETHVNDGGQNLLAGYRGAQYFSLGLGGLGVLLAAAFLVQTYAREPPPPPQEK